MTYRFDIPDEYQNLDMFLLAVSGGAVPGWSYIEKFGENPNVQTGAPEDIWSYGGLYPWSTSADIDTLSSSNVGDDQELIVYGLDADCAEVDPQTVTLNGRNKVTLGTPLYRVYRIINNGTTNIAGVVYCYVDGDITDGVPDTAADVRATIVDGNNQTEMAIYTIPAGKIGFFLGGYVSSSKAGVNNNVVFTWRLRFEDKVLRVQSRIATLAAGNSSWNYRYPVPVGPVPPCTDIAITAETVTVNGTGAAGGFTILLKDLNHFGS